jgi:Mn-dependent DtxR family transcriptional regulator
MTDADRIMRAAIIESLAPEGAREIQLAQRIATDSWRLHRLSAVEDNLFALGHSAHSDDIEAEHLEIHAAPTAAKVLKEESKKLPFLTLHEQRMNRNLQKEPRDSPGCTGRPRGQTRS